MATNLVQRAPGLSPNRMVLIAIGLMAVAVVAAILIFADLSDTFRDIPYLFLLPWVIGLAVVMTIPSLILYYRGEFSLANPIVFATISFFTPAFVFGGVFLSLGLSQPYYLPFIQDPESNLPMTAGLLALGFASLATGYFLPIGGHIGRQVKAILPSADYSSNAFLLPGLILLVLGVANTIFAFTVGLFGYQISEETNIYGGLIYLSTLFRVQGVFLLWLVVFKERRLNVLTVAVVALVLVVDVGSALFAGNRGMILNVFFVIMLAYVFSGRKITLKQGVVASMVLSVGLMAGMIYGTTFRMVKGTELRQSSGEYTENISKTFDEVGRRSASESILMGLAIFSERLDVFSTVAVVVSTHEQLKPFEEAYGLDNNIWSDTTTFFIPRVVWNDKPAASDARKYSDLYFNTSESSFAITPVGDLLRNYGATGIFVGMLILGVVLRLMYDSLIDPQGTPIWRTMIYFMLLTTVSYEGFYGTIIPMMFKVGLTALLGVLVVVFIARKMDPKVRPANI